jgi:uncharacterized protein YpuA (DUF1002 family)
MSVYWHSYVVPPESVRACTVCGLKLEHPEVVTVAAPIMVCGDCMLAGMMSRLEVRLDQIEAKLPEISLDTREKRAILSGGGDPE